MMQHKWIGVVIGFLLSTQILATEKKTLAQPGKKLGLVAIERGIAGLLVTAGSIFQLPESRSQLLVTPFDPKAQDGSIFAKATDHRRIPLGSEHTSSQFRALIQIVNILGVVDGQHLEVITLTPDFQQLRTTSMPWDLIQPAADSRGEPTRHEIDQLRARFHKAMKTRKKKLIISGLTPFGSPKNSWQSYLAATHVPDFPLITLKCRHNLGITCLFDRACNLEKISPAFQPTGISLLNDKKTLLLGDAKVNQIRVAQVESCYHVRQTTSFSLPHKFKTLSNLTVDKEDRLWVTTSSPDDYTNASAHAWEKEAWMPLIE